VQPNVTEVTNSSLGQSAPFASLPLAKSRLGATASAAFAAGHRLGAWVIPEGALVVKAALLEEEHDFGAVVVLST
jgi:hypothetical protein